MTDDFFTSHFLPTPTFDGLKPVAPERPIAPRLQTARRAGNVGAAVTAIILLPHKRFAQGSESTHLVDIECSWCVCAIVLHFCNTRGRS